MVGIKREAGFLTLVAVEGEMRRLSRNISKRDSPKIARPKNPLAKLLDDDEFSLEAHQASLLSTEESD